MDIEQEWYKAWDIVDPHCFFPFNFHKILTKYSESHRYYHNILHITECIALFNQMEHLCNNPLAVRLALFYHDYEYDVFNPNNEHDSAEIAHFEIERVRHKSDLADTVRDLILATRHQPGSQLVTDNDTQILLDIDLSILGASYSRYKLYQHQIRQEYISIPQDKYVTGRIEVLGKFINRDRLYLTDFCHEKFEKDAKINMCMERVDLQEQLVDNT